LRYRLVTAFGVSGREDARTECSRWRDRLDCKRESGSSLGEPAQVRPTELAASEVQLEGAALTAAERIRGVEGCCTVRVGTQMRTGSTSVRSSRKRARRVAPVANVAQRRLKPKSTPRTKA
jgi:hypothetical protein